MERVFMRKVGDALNFYLEEHKDKPMLMVDFGFENKNTFNFVFCLGKQPLCDVFLLSHFHKDHYNGFSFCHQSIFCFNKIILPRFPHFIKGTITNHTIIPLFVLHALITNNLWLSVIQLICSSTKTNPFVQLVSKGDVFSHNNYEYNVLWPPLNYDDKELTNSVGILLKEWEKLKEADKDLSDIYDSLEKLNIEEQNNIVTSFGEINFEKLEISLKKYTDRPKDVIEKQLLNFNNALKKVANRLSIAFYQDNNVLFLGDLMSNELNHIIKDLRKDDKTNFNVIVAAHHGTHWGTEMNHLKCKNCLASVGDKLYKNVQNKEYRMISERVFKTVDSGEINLYLNDKLKL